MTTMMRETLIPRSVCTLHFLPYHCKLSQFEPLGPQKFNLVNQSFDISHKFGIWMVKCFVSGRNTYVWDLHQLDHCYVHVKECRLLCS